ncbi:hypothetical protein D9M71_292160 [compost metagenome]
MEAKGRPFNGWQAGPVGAGRLQQGISADNIGVNELCRAIDRTVDMGLGSQVHDHLGLEALQHSADGSLVGDVGLDELVTRIRGNADQRFQIAGVCQLVQVEHFMFGVPDQVTDQGRADEAGTAGNENAHVEWPFA